MMRRRWIVTISMLAALVWASIVIPSAFAGKFHFNSTSFSLGGSMVFNGDLAGLGNAVARVTLIGSGSVTALCENQGGNQAPGRNAISISVQQTNTFTTDSNGKANVEIHAPDPTGGSAPSPSPKQAGCPPGNWTVVGIIDGSTDWKSARVIVRDSSGAIQFEQSYTCKTTFNNGVGVDLQCN